jgi:hypothetical protein
LLSLRLKPSAAPLRLADMDEDPDPLVFPDMPDEAVVAINQFLEAFYTHFQNHYFAQMHRWYHKLDRRQHYDDQIPLPLDDPPF